jgi:hypothetical protein
VSKAVTRATPAVTAERVERIVGLMRRDEWRRGETAPVLAKEWGLATNTVEQLASEASRVVAREVTDPGMVTETVAVTLATNLERASKASEYGDVARIADVWTRIVGARAPERHEHAVVVAQFESLPREGKLRWIDERIAKLQAARVALLGAGEKA